MQKQLTDYDAQDLVKLAIGAGAYSSSPVWGGKGQSPATNPHAVTSNPTGGFGTELGKALAPAGKAIWDNGGKHTLNAGINTLDGIGTTATGLANVAAGGIGSLAAGVNQGAARFQDAVGLTHDATSVADAFAKPMNRAFFAGLKDTVGGAADTLSGGNYNYDGTEFIGAQPTTPSAGTAVGQMRADMRGQLGPGTTADMAFRGANAVGDFFAETAAFGGLGRGINVGAKAVQGSRAAPVLNAAAQTPVVGKPLAATGKWLAGAAPEANMFAKTPMQYARATGVVGLADEAANAQNHFVNAVDPVEQPSLTGPEATQPNPQGGPSTAQKPPSGPTQVLNTEEVQAAPGEAPLGHVSANEADEAFLANPDLYHRDEAAAVREYRASKQQPPKTELQTSTAPAAAPKTQPAPAAGYAGSADKTFADIMPKLSDDKIPAPERQQMAMSAVNKHVQSNPQLLQGMQDIQAGRADTESAKVFQSQIDNAQNQMIKAEFEKLKQANPTANLSDPNTYAGFLSQAANTATTKFNEMPMEHKMLTGLGLGGGLIGILSSLFGGGGMAGGLLGMLGLAAGGMAGAAGGMFGNQAQAATGKLMGDMGSFLGMIPDEARDAKNLMPGSAASKAFEAQVAQTFKEQGPEAAQKLIDARTAQFKPLEQMHATSPQFAHSFLMGMDNGPKTPEEAAALYEQLSGQVTQARDPNFLRNKATETAAEQVSGLQNRVPAWLRVGARLGKDNIPGLKSILPTSMQEMIDNASTDPRVVAEREIAKRYAQQPQRETRASVNIAQEIYFKQAVQKAARCWAGYEPVPGKAPYSENSCRPKRKAKKKSKEPSK